MTDTNISLRESIIVTVRHCALQCKCQGRAALVFIETHTVTFHFYHWSRFFRIIHFFVGKCLHTHLNIDSGEDIFKHAHKRCHTLFAYFYKMSMSQAFLFLMYLTEMQRIQCKRTKRNSHSHTYPNTPLSVLSPEFLLCNGIFMRLSITCSVTLIVVRVWVCVHTFYWH